MPATIKTVLIALIILILMGTVINAQPNCSATSTGFIPINDLAKGTFTNAWNEVWLGGLYPNGSNYLPAAHKSAGIQMASQVQYLNSNGSPDATNGKIVWLSIGMSNGTQETQQFIPLANAFADKNPGLIMVDGAQGGQTTNIISTKTNSNYTTYWNTVYNRLSSSGVSANQVQVIWIKEANVANVPIRDYYDSLVVQLIRTTHEIKNRFPNVKLCYLASRISARYASSALNPEPYAYYTGWAIKKVIEKQIQGDPELAFSGINAKSPWLSWGIYMWTDGSTAQITNPGIFWNCSTDFQTDGTHPSTIGAKKVGTLLVNFFSNDSTSSRWFNNKAITSTSNPKKPGNYIKLFPNPAKGHFSLLFSEEIKNGSLCCYDLSGKLILKSEKLNSKQITIKRNELPAGVYLIKIYSGEKLYTTQKIRIE